MRTRSPFWISHLAKFRNDLGHCAIRVRPANDDAALVGAILEDFQLVANFQPVIRAQRDFHEVLADIQHQPVQLGWNSIDIFEFAQVVCPQHFLHPADLGDQFGLALFQASFQVFRLVDFVRKENNPFLLVVAVVLGDLDGGPCVGDFGCERFQAGLGGGHRRSSLAVRDQQFGVRRLGGAAEVSLDLTRLFQSRQSVGPTGPLAGQFLLQFT